MYADRANLAPPSGLRQVGPPCQAVDVDGPLLTLVTGDARRGQDHGLVGLVVVRPGTDLQLVEIGLVRGYGSGHPSSCIVQNRKPMRPVLVDRPTGNEESL